MATAFAAAYLLVLQSAVGAFALGLGPNPAQLDGFGNVICTHEGTAELPAGNPYQKHVPTCCVLGCTMASPALGAAPDAGRLQIKLSYQTVVYRPLTPAHLALDREWSPSNPRAPPVV